MPRTLAIVATMAVIALVGCRSKPTPQEDDAVVQKFLKSGRIDRAIAYLKGRLAQDPSERVLHRLVDLLGKRQQWREASRVLAEYVSSHKASAQTWYLLGWTRHMERKDEAAVDALAEALRLDPTHLDAIELMGRIYEVHGYDKEAMELYLRVAQDTSKGPRLVPILQRLASLEVRHGKYAEAEAHLKVALGLEPGEPKASERLILLLVRRHKLTDALKVAQRWIDKHPKDPRAHMYKGMVLQKLGKNEEALRELMEAVDIDDSEVEALTRVSDLLFTMGRYKDAFTYLVKAVALAPDSKPVNRMLAPLYFARGLYGAANRALEKWGDRTEPRYWILKARLAEAQGDYEGAYQAAMSVLTLVRNPSAGLRAWAGILAREAGRYDKAVELLSGAAEADDFADPLLSVWGAAPVELTDTDVLRELAIALFMTGKERKGVAVLRKLLERGDTMAGVWLAEFELRKKRPSKALAVLRKVKPSTDVEHLFYYDVKARALEARGSYVDALKALSTMSGYARSEQEASSIQQRILRLQGLMSSGHGKAGEIVKKVLKGR